MSCVIIGLVIVAILLFLCLFIGKWILNRRIRFIAKYIGVFCFQMKGAAVFDKTVLRCNHIVGIECFKKLKAMRSCP